MFSSDLTMEFVDSHEIICLSSLLAIYGKFMVVHSSRESPTTNLIRFRITSISSAIDASALFPLLSLSLWVLWNSRTKEYAPAHHVRNYKIKKGVH